jgi:hypothetical protein
MVDQKLIIGSIDRRSADGGDGGQNHVLGSGTYPVMVKLSYPRYLKAPFLSLRFSTINLNKK